MAAVNSIPIKVRKFACGENITFSQLEIITWDSNEIIFNIKKRFSQNGLRNRLNEFGDHLTENLFIGIVNILYFQRKAGNFYYYCPTI